MKLTIRFISIVLLAISPLFCVSCVETKDSYSLAGLFPVPKIKMDAFQQNNPSPGKPESASTPDHKPEAETPIFPKQPAIPVKAHYRWSDPAREKIWEDCIKHSVRLSTKPRMADVDVHHAEKQLETFGTIYMPNAYAQYQEIRTKALDLDRTVAETFPRGRASDPTGGEMYEKANKRLAIEVAQMFRRHDELCYFLLLHQAGLFPDTVLTKFDGRPISISMDLKEDSWPDDTPQAPTWLSTEDAAFADSYMPATCYSFKKLHSLFEEGAMQYRELRQTALALDAARAHRNLSLLRTRLEEIKKECEAQHVALSVWRMKLALGEVDQPALTAADVLSASKIQTFLKEHALNHYFLKHSKTTDTTIILPGGVPMEMVWCPPGSFIMGGPENQHAVTIESGFLMAKYEVTQKQWWSVMEYNPWEVYRGFVPGQVEEGAFLPKYKGDDLPVHHVSWEECVAFCQKAGNSLQLPTEEQWEYACRAGSTGPYGGTGNLDEMGWHESNSRSQPHSVGEKLPNAWGLYDMHGNILEWCLDQTYSGERVQRGGSYKKGRGSCQSYSVDDAGQKVGNYDFGFRPCCPAKLQ